MNWGTYADNSQISTSMLKFLSSNTRPPVEYANLLLGVSEGIIA
jgi:hypothetical protein